MKKLKQLLIGLENCETITIPAKNIKHLAIHDVTTLFDMNLEKEVQSNLVTDGYLIVVSSINGCTSNFQHVTKLSQKDYLKQTFFKDGRNITNLQLDYDDGTEISMMVNWIDQTSDYTHDRQSIEVKGTRCHIKQVTTTKKGVSNNG